MTRNDKAGDYLRPSESLGPVLRQQAEAALRAQAGPTAGLPETLSPEALHRALHELRVSQVELEMQNDELRRAQAALDATRVRYFSLYDMAPVGQCSVTHSGLIFEANFAAAALLGWGRGALIGQPVSRFIFPEDQDVYYLHRRRVADTGVTQCCELRLLQVDGKTVWVRLIAVIDRAGEGAPGLRMALVELGERG